MDNKNEQNNNLLNNTQTQQIDAPPIPPPKEKINSIRTPKIYLVILIAAILIVSVAYAGISISKNGQIAKINIKNTAEKQIPSPTPDPTLNWISYTGSFYTFKYNPEWKIAAEVKEPEKEYIVIEVKDRSFIYVNVLTEKDKQEASDSAELLRQYAGGLDLGTAAAEFAKQIETKEFMINGRQAIKVGMKDTSFQTVTIKGEKNDLLITLGGTGKALSSTEFDQFLSTFVLTK